MTTMRFESGGEFDGESRLEREGHAELRDANAERLEVAFAESEIAQRLREVVVGFARRRDAEPCAVPRAVPAIHAVSTRELAGRFQAPDVHFGFERRDVIGATTRASVCLR